MGNGTAPSTRKSQTNEYLFFTNDEGAAISPGQPVCLSASALAAGDFAEGISRVELPDAANLPAFQGIANNQSDIADEGRLPVVHYGPVGAIVDKTGGLAHHEKLEVLANQDYLSPVRSSGLGRTVGRVIGTVASVSEQSLAMVWIDPSLESEVDVGGSVS